VRLSGSIAVPLAVAAAVVLAACGSSGGDGSEGTAPAPRVAGGQGDGTQPESAEELGFPAFATSNTTRIGGSDSAAVAAGAALATFPSAGPSPQPAAVTIVPEDRWQAGIAAAALVAEPIQAPILIGSQDGLPSITEDALEALDPRGGPTTGGAAAFAIGDMRGTSELDLRPIAAGPPAREAAAIAGLRAELARHGPEHIVIAASEAPAFAMPAAAWAARSGDPVLFARRHALPEATASALERYPEAPVYLLGPPQVISDAVLREISRISGQVRRVGAKDPVANAIQFARYVDGSFGWDINDPGHGFVVARSDRPLDAAAAAPLSGSGTWGPLLLTDSTDSLPDALRGYMLDVKPGYEEDPTRALYNHVWVIGDQEAIDVNQQAALDQLAELTRIGGEAP
jgi:hypothetical protein